MGMSSFMFHKRKEPICIRAFYVFRQTDKLTNWRTDKWKWNWRTDELTNWRTDKWKWNWWTDEADELMKLTNWRMKMKLMKLTNWRTDKLTNENETDETDELTNWRTDEWKWNWWNWRTDELTNWRTDKWKWAPPCETEEGGKKGALCPPSPENKKRSCLFLISKVEIRNKQPHCLKFYNLPHPINTEP